jgi:NAD(P)-dependent dehydrogenase (short-subunit alcohol dehydrogenase family)
MFRTEAQTEQMMDRHPLKQVGSPQDISNAIAFLLSTDSGWMTGQVIGVDGGLSTIKK